MSQLHPTSDDYEFSEAHANAGWNKAVRRCMRLRALLERVRSGGDGALDVDIDAALKQTAYEESDAFPPSGWESKS